MLLKRKNSWSLLFKIVLLLLIKRGVKSVSQILMSFLTCVT